MIDLARLNASLPTLSEQFRTAKPFPHVVIDGVCEDGELRDAVKHWPTDPEAFRTYQKGKRSTIPHSGPLHSLLLESRSDAFAAFLSDLGAVPGLIIGDNFSGGGYAEVVSGGFLPMHCDFNTAKHETYGTIYRRINCLLYLNLKWKPEWNGALELRRKPSDTKDSVTIEPMFNRMVVFESSERSWHGHPKELACPRGVTRRYLGIYGFTAEKPKWFKTQHSTIYAR